MIDTPFQLDDGERRHVLWQRLKGHLEQRLARKRAENDKPLDEQQTARIRGHIECLKGLIALGDEPPPHSEG